MLSLFQQVVVESGLSAMLGPGAIRRACIRAGVDPQQLSRTDLLRAIPNIEATLHAYLSSVETKNRVAAILRLTRASSAGIAIVLDDEKLDED